ncbi:uncharacterized protein isoform X3 [Choristoneura fumiferana]|uniref:uncharacterized protein isoform X3 n=1 Tax=Choristoneura fumiferana TaxID=7141 RepID=UPI003D15E4EA
MSGRLVVLDRGGRAGKRFPLAAGLATLGRGAGCDIRVLLPAVSQHHATITVHANQTVVRNVGSGATLVNGAAVSVHALRHGDELSLGGRRLRWEYDHPPRRQGDPLPQGTSCRWYKVRAVAGTRYELSLGGRRLRWEYDHPPRRQGDPLPQGTSCRWYKVRAVAGTRYELSLGGRRLRWEYDHPPRRQGDPLPQGTSCRWYKVRAVAGTRYELSLGGRRLRWEYDHPPRRQGDPLPQGTSCRWYKVRAVAGRPPPALGVRPPAAPPGGPLAPRYELSLVQGTSCRWAAAACAGNTTTRRAARGTPCPKVRAVAGTRYELSLVQGTSCRWAAAACAGSTTTRRAARGTPCPKVRAVAGTRYELSLGGRRLRWEYDHPPRRQGDPLPQASSTGGKQVAIVQPQRRDTSNQNDSAVADAAAARGAAGGRADKRARGSLADAPPQSARLSTPTKATLWIESRRGRARAASLRHATPLRLAVLRRSAAPAKIQAPAHTDHTKQAAIMLMTGYTPKKQATLRRSTPSFVAKKRSPRASKTPRASRTPAATPGASPAASPAATPAAGSARRGTKMSSGNQTVSILEISDSEAGSFRRSRSGPSAPRPPRPPCRRAPASPR